jgi:hypothetical protein
VELSRHPILLPTRSCQPPEELIPEIQEEEDVEIVQDRRQNLIAVRPQEW